MTRFVTVSFLFLGWAFFELSGGADFQPLERPDQTPATARTANARLDEPSAASNTDRVTAASLVTQPVMQPRPRRRDPVAAIPRGGNEPAGNRPVAASAPAASTALTTLASLAPQGSLFAQPVLAESFQIASLSDGIAGATADGNGSTAAPDTGLSELSPSQLAALLERTAAGPDMRRITGSRVNMRGGPGTVYPVISRLTRGQQVEVLSDSGTGWLRLRNIDKNQVGWIAASLVSRKAP